MNEFLIFKIILLWPRGRGQPPEIEAFKVQIPFEIIQVENVVSFKK